MPSASTWGAPTTAISHLAWGTTTALAQRWRDWKHRWRYARSCADSQTSTDQRRRPAGRPRSCSAARPHFRFVCASSPARPLLVPPKACRGAKGDALSEVAFHDPRAKHFEAQVPAPPKKRGRARTVKPGAQAGETGDRWIDLV